MYCDMSDVTDRIDVQNIPTFNMESLIRAETRRIEMYCSRVFTRVPSTALTYEARNFLGRGEKVLPIDDLLELSTITADGVAVVVADVRLFPYGRTPTTWLEYEDRAAWERGSEIIITAGWGYATAPPWDIWDACVALCVRSMERAKMAYADASAIPELGQLVYARAIPVDIRQVLDLYRKLSV
jgi:hypothetical protein